MFVYISVLYYVELINYGGALSFGQDLPGMFLCENKDLSSLGSLIWIRQYGVNGFVKFLR